MEDNRYVKILERVYQLLNSCPDPNKKRPDGGWTIKEIIGHLIDSVSNNHQRLLRYKEKGQLDFPGYDQELFVKRANYKDFEFRTLLSFWYSYNKLLIHIYSVIPSGDTLTSTIKVGDRDPITINQLLNDYFAHMENHERQIQGIVNS